MAVIHRIRTIDAHAAGEPLRLVVEGMPAPEGRTMLEKRAWAMKRLDHLRKALILEPRCDCTAASRSCSMCSW